jgi:hypothetical protein
MNENAEYVVVLLQGKVLFECGKLIGETKSYVYYKVKGINDFQRADQEDKVFYCGMDISDHLKDYNDAYAEKYQELQDFRRELIQRAEREFGVE